MLLFSTITRIFSQFLFSFLALLSLLLFVTGCGGGAGEGTPEEKTSLNTVIIHGAVNDTIVPFAKVRLVLEATNEDLAKLVADENGQWSYEVKKESLPADSFITIYAMNPKNNIFIRSVIDTDEVLQSHDSFKTDETTVSHYTEAAIILAEKEGEIDQEKFNEFADLITLKNGEPTLTGNEELDSLAETVQTNFEDEESNQDILTLSVYKDLLAENTALVIPNEYGDVSINLPQEYNDEIILSLEQQDIDNIHLANDNLSFTLTPEQRQKDMNISLTLKLNAETIYSNILLYAIGNNKGHYVYETEAPTSDITASQTTALINGRLYTLIPYSFIALREGNVSSEVISIDGKLRDRTFSTLKIAKNYTGSKVLVRVYEGDENFDTNTLVAESEITLLASNTVDIGNLEVTRVDDYRPVEPNDKNIELPPVAPSF